MKVHPRRVFYVFVHTRVETPEQDESVAESLKLSELH